LPDVEGDFNALYDDTKIHGVPPAEADIQRYFNVSAPSVHSMIVTLDKRRLIRGTSGAGRSIQLLLSREQAGLEVTAMSAATPGGERKSFAKFWRRLPAPSLYLR
jgi:repressor LexA